MLRRNHALAASLYFVLTNSFASQWVEIESTEAHGRISDMHVFIDNETIVRDGKFVTVWYRFTQSGGPGQQYNSTYDCKHQVKKTNEAFLLEQDSSRSKNDIPFSNDFTPITPDSVSSVVLKALCSRKWYEIWEP